MNWLNGGWNGTGQTALQTAIQERDETSALLLLRLQALPDTQDRLGLSPLFHAARDGNQLLVQSLLTAGCWMRRQRWMQEPQLVAEISHPKILQLIATVNRSCPPLIWLARRSFRSHNRQHSRSAAEAGHLPATLLHYIDFGDARDPWIWSFILNLPPYSICIYLGIYFEVNASARHLSSLLPPARSTHQTPSNYSIEYSIEYYLTSFDIIWHSLTLPFLSYNTSYLFMSSFFFHMLFVPSEWWIQDFFFPFLSSRCQLSIHPPNAISFLIFLSKKIFLLMLTYLFPAFLSFFLRILNKDFHPPFSLPASTLILPPVTTGSSRVFIFLQDLFQGFQGRFFPPPPPPSSVFFDDLLRLFWRIFSGSSLPCLVFLANISISAVVIRRLFQDPRANNLSV